MVNLRSLFHLAHLPFETLAASSPLPPLRSTPAAATRFSFPVTPLHPGAGSPRPAQLHPRATAPPRLPVSRPPGAPSARPRPNPSLAPACFAAPHSSGADGLLRAPLRSTFGAALPPRTSASSPVWLKRRAAPPREWRVGMGLAAGGSAVSVTGASPPRLAVAPCPAPSRHLALAAPYSTPRASPPRRLPRSGPAWCARGGSGSQPWPGAQILRWRLLRSQIRWWVVGQSGAGGCSGGRSGSLWGALPPDERRSSKALPWLACVAQRSRCGLILMEQCGVAPAPWAQIKFPSQCQTKSRLEFGMFAAASSSVEYKAEEISINPPFQRWSRLVPLLKASQGTCIGVNSRCLLLELGCLLDFQLVARQLILKHHPEANTGSFARMGAHLNTSM
ncbi:hypothetical protein U9M48_018339 [Paspalum notatum var. saurae]|uniref:Uncharacterized protein n=1 Tax=Paspalum notatum var. saurae TaxID=547442 RepID=A0AAQ3T988_PASNO